MQIVCGYGEIGRRNRLRIYRLWRAGSTPVTRTKLKIKALLSFFYLYGYSDRGFRNL